MSDFAALQAECEQDPPRVVVVLGSGLGHLAAQLVRPLSVPFSAIPGLPAAGVVGHKGQLTLAEWGRRKVLVYEGRVHFYEGHPWEVVVRPIQIAHQLGARVALLTNAAGGIRADLEAGSLMAIADHMEWTRPFWWRLPGPGGLGAARPSPYDPGLLELLTEAAGRVKVSLSRGIYAAMTGPCYETPAEVRALRACGADAVGMSTAREVQAGADLGMRCAAISCVTNKAAGLAGHPLNHQEVLEVARQQGERLAHLLGAVLDSLEG